MTQLVNPTVLDMEAAKFEVVGEVAIITLNRPEAANSLNTAMHRDVIASFEELSNNPALKAGVITGTGRFFCAGRDIREFLNQYGEEDKGLRPIDDPEHPMFGKLCNHWPVRKPLVGAINGGCVGAGLELASLCDMIVMAEGSYIASLHAKVNIGGAGNLRKFISIFPVNIARELAMTERRLTAEECHRWGFANRVVTPDDLVRVAIELALGTTVMGPDAIKGLKQASLEVQQQVGLVELDIDWNARREQRRASLEATRDRATDPDLMEGMKAFAERRKARYEKTV